MGLKEGDPRQRTYDLDFGRSYHDTLHYHPENAGSDKDVGFAEVHHKDFAGRWRSIALEDFVEAGSFLAGMEVSIHSHLGKISSRREVM